MHRHLIVLPLVALFALAPKPASACGEGGPTAAIAIVAVAALAGTAAAVTTSAVLSGALPDPDPSRAATRQQALFRELTSGLDADLGAAYRGAVTWRW